MNQVQHTGRSPMHKGFGALASKGPIYTLHKWPCMWCRLLWNRHYKIRTDQPSRADDHGQHVSGGHINFWLWRAPVHHGKPLPHAKQEHWHAQPNPYEMCLACDGAHLQSTTALTSSLQENYQSKEVFGTLEPNQHAEELHSLEGKYTISWSDATKNIAVGSHLIGQNLSRVTNQYQ